MNQVEKVYKSVSKYIKIMKARQVLKLLNISRITLYNYVKK